MDKLVDIKDFTQVPDVSLYIFLSLTLFVLLVLVFAGLKLYKYLKSKGKSDKEKAKEILQNLDFKNAKLCAYTITKYAPFLVENDASSDMLEELTNSLSKYKYQKNVPEFNQKDKEMFKTFMDLCNA